MAPLRAALGLGALSLVACGGDDPSAVPADAEREDDAADEAGIDAGTEAAVDAGPRTLVHAALWRPVEAEPAAGDAAVACTPDSFGEEVLGGVLSFYVRTERCPTLTVQQASREAVSAGQTVRLRLYHFPLSAFEPAVARLWLRLGDDELWRAELPIPSPQGELSAEWTATQDYAAGTVLQFHVENHGTNEYLLIAVERL